MINKGLKDKMYTYFISNMGMRDYRNNWLKGDCPYCGKRDKFGVNLVLNRSNCFVCGGKLNPFYLIKDLEDLETKRDVLNFLNSYEGLEYFEKSFERLKQPDHKISLPEGFNVLNIGNNQLALSMRRYVKKRGFDPDEVGLKGWGYGTKGKYWGYLIIPVYQKGELVYYTARRVMGDGPKFLNASTDEIPIGKNFIIYNYESLFIYNKIRIVESIINAETLGDSTIAINGKSLSFFQFSQLIKSPCEYVDILLDRDAWINAIYIALKLAPYKKVRPVLFKDDRDVNDLGKLKTLKLIFKNGYLTYNECLKLKNDYEGSFLTHN